MAHKFNTGTVNKNLVTRFNLFSYVVDLHKRVQKSKP